MEPDCFINKQPIRTGNNVSNNNPHRTKTTSESTKTTMQHNHRSKTQMFQATEAIATISFCLVSSTTVTISYFFTQRLKQRQQIKNYKRLIS